MQTRTYRAPTLPKALAEVQADLGDDALVVTARKVLEGPAWQVWREPLFEIVALPAPNGKSSAPDSAALATQKPEPGAILAQDVAAMRATLAQFVRYIDPVQAHWPAAVTAIHQRLISQEVDAQLALEIVATVMETLSSSSVADGLRVRELIARDLKSRISTWDPISPGQDPLLIALVGPSGSGKTLAVAKLAGFIRFALHRKPALLTLDTFGIGALPQIRTLAEIMQLPLTVAYSSDELKEALSALSGTDVLLIDTPARNPQRAEEISALAELMAPLPASRKLLLVANATAKGADLSRAAAAFEPLGIDGLLFSHLDETEVYGSMFSLACSTGWPVTYFSSSPHVLDDIEPASADRFVNLMLAGVQ